MSQFLTVIVMILMLLIWDNVSAQQIETDFSLSATGGSVSNTYLMPHIPEWDRSRISGYTSLTPAGQLQWNGKGRNAILYSAGHILHFYDDRPAWIGGYLTPVVRQHVVSGFTAKASGGWSYYSSTYSRNMQWLYGGLEWIVTPFSKIEISAGSGWRSYKGLADRPEDTRRYDSYGIEFQYWPSYRWQFLSSFHSSLAYITHPADGFAASLAVVHYRRSGTSVMLQTGLEQYSMEFQSNLSDGLLAGSGKYTDMPAFSQVETPQNGEVDRLENRFHRTSLKLSHSFGDWISVNGTLSGLLWFSSEDNDIVSDFQVSAGVQVPLSFPATRYGEISSINWKTKLQEDPDQDQQADRERFSKSESNDEQSTATGQENTLEHYEKLHTTITIRYKGDTSLYITGDFIDWEDPGIPLQKSGRNRYSVEFDLSAGVYEYKIGKRKNDRNEWLEFPDDVTTVNDGFGGKNGRLFIDY